MWLLMLIIQSILLCHVRNAVNKWQKSLKPYIDGTGTQNPRMGRVNRTLDMQSRRRYTHNARLPHGYVTHHTHASDTSVCQADR